MENTRPPLSSGMSDGGQVWHQAELSDGEREGWTRRGMCRISGRVEAGGLVMRRADRVGWSARRRLCHGRVISAHWTWVPESILNAPVASKRLQRGVYGALSGSRAGWGVRGLVIGGFAGSDGGWR